MDHPSIARNRRTGSVFPEPQQQPHSLLSIDIPADDHDHHTPSASPSPSPSPSPPPMSSPSSSLSSWPATSSPRQSHALLKSWREEQDLPTHYVKPPAATTTTPSLLSRHGSRLSFRRASFAACIFITIYLTSVIYPSHFKQFTVLIQTHCTLSPTNLTRSLHHGEQFRFPSGSDYDNFYIPISQEGSLSRAAALLAGGPISSSESTSPSSSPYSPSIPYECLDDHISFGSPCLQPAPFDAQPKLDVVWAYVNGSDTLHQDAYMSNFNDMKYAHPDKYYPPPKRGSMREYDELRYSMRSVVAHFRDSARKLWVVTSDFPFPGEEGGCAEEGPRWRLGQLPQWLNPSKWLHWKDGGLPLEVVHHNAIFPPMHNASMFNSLAIESRLANIDGLSDYFVYMNDDVFFNANLSAFDFYTTELGPVFRMQSDLLVGGWGASRGEWVALQRSNALLDDRFGVRSRPYLIHIAKTMSMPVLRELSHIWSGELALTSSHPFRSLTKVDPDVSTTLLHTHFIVERWREALLWSWIVGSIGGEKDEWRSEHARKAWRELGGTLELKEMNVTRSDRRTLQVATQKIHDAMAEHHTKTKTSYVYSSFDGYPYSGLGRSGFSAFPSFDPGSKKPLKAHPGTVCTLDWQICLAKNANSTTASTASSIFQQVAFRLPECGDCIIHALMNKSGELGLDAFLPSSSRKFPSRTQVDGDSIPRLPLTKAWESTDFSLEGVGKSTRNDLSIREWVVRALHRYRFVLAGTQSTFLQLESYMSAAQLLRHVDAYNGTSEDPAIICINDDVGREAVKVRSMLGKWFGNRWGKPAEWEVV